MKKIEAICVFSGSTYGTETEYKKKAEELGGYMARHGIRLVYGGGNRGLMGTVADAVKSGGGTSIGVLPEAMDMPSVRTKDVETELIIARDMHERKKMMYERADAFIALPGGIGTLDELFEIYTWKQLGYHEKPIALLNVDGYWDGLLSFLDEMTAKGFLSTEARRTLKVVANIENLLEELEKDEEALPSKL